MENKKLIEYFEEIETEKEYDGYYYKISEVITIVILGSICGLRNLQQIHQWAVKERTSEFLKEEFGINRIPCCYWLTCILKIIKPESLNKCFENWVRSVMPEKADQLTLSVDGKTVCSTGRMQEYENPLHIEIKCKVFLKLKKGHGRIEKRTAFVTYKTDWLVQKNEWKNLKCIGAIYSESIYEKRNFK